MFENIKAALAAFKSDTQNVDTTNEDKLYYYRGHVQRVVDGDTFDIIVDMGFSVFQLIRFRLLGVDTPEVRGAEREAGLEVSRIVTEMIEGKEVILKSTKKGSFSRYLAEIWIADKNLGDYLLTEGYAEVYKK